MNNLLTAFQRAVQSFRNGFNGNAPALAVVSHAPDMPESSHTTASLQEAFDAILKFAVPKRRRTKQVRKKRKFSDRLMTKYTEDKRKILVCGKCGHYYEAGILCDYCYQKAKKETQRIWNKIGEKYLNFQYYNVENDPKVVRKSFKFKPKGYSFNKWFIPEESEVSPAVSEERELSKKTELQDEKS